MKRVGGEVVRSRFTAITRRLGRWARPRAHWMIWLVTSVVITALGLLLLTSGLDEADKYASVIGALGTLAGLGLSLSALTRRTLTTAPPESRPHPQAARSAALRAGAMAASVAVALVVGIGAWALASQRGPETRPGPHDAVPPGPAESAAPTTVPQPSSPGADGLSQTTSGSATPSATPRVPSAECHWQGDSQCQATSKVDPTDSVAECSGSGGQGGGGCSVRVD